MTTTTMKCPVCDWDIEKPLSVTVSGRTVSVCCEECADKLKIRDHVEGLFRAFLARDREAIRRGHTKDWKGFQVKSQKLVRGIDGYMEAADTALATFRGTGYEILDLDIQLHGAVAVVFYLAEYRLTEGSIRLRALDLYRREEGGWNQCGSNICLVPAA
jgi:hypothetical protein